MLNIRQFGQIGKNFLSDSAQLMVIGGESRLGLVAELVGRAVGELCVADEVEEGVESAELSDLLLSGDPAERQGGGCGNLAEEVERDNLRQLHGADLVSPNVRQFGVHQLRGIEHGGEDAALAHRLFPERLTELGIRFTGGILRHHVSSDLAGYIVDAGNLDAEIHPVVGGHACVAHHLRRHTVHVGA